jgi:DnaK suppressor protein
VLTPQQIEELRAVLLAERERILTSARNTAEFSRDRDITRIGRDSIDESAAEALFGTKLRLADRESQLLNKVNAALERLERGEHGVCEDCDEPIQFARLQARPVTTLCIPCQEDREQT